MQRRNRFCLDSNHLFLIFFENLKDAFLHATLWTKTIRASFYLLRNPWSELLHWPWRQDHAASGFVQVQIASWELRRCNTLQCSSQGHDHVVSGVPKPCVLHHFLHHYKHKTRVIQRYLFTMFYKHLDFHRKSVIIPAMQHGNGNIYHFAMVFHRILSYFPGKLGKSCWFQPGAASLTAFNLAVDSVQRDKVRGCSGDPELNHHLPLLLGGGSVAR